PHGAFPVFGIAMNETLNAVGDADVYLGHWAETLWDGLNDLQDAEQRVAFVQCQLTLQLRTNLGRPLQRRQEAGHAVVAHCVRALKSADGRVPIRELEQTTGYSRRYLDQLFRRHVGLSPKVLGGIFRFRRFYGRW